LGRGSKKEKEPSTFTRSRPLILAEAKPGGKKIPDRGVSLNNKGKRAERNEPVGKSDNDISDREPQGAGNFSLEK